MPVHGDYAGQAVPKILFVDDEPNILRAIVRMMRSEPIQVLTAVGGEAGLAVLQEHQVHVIVTDYRMPGMDGFQFLERARVLSPNSLRIFLTGFAEAKALTEAVNQGHVHKILHKPWNDQELILTVRAALGQCPQNQETTSLQSHMPAQEERLQTLTTDIEGGPPKSTQSRPAHETYIEVLHHIINHLPCAVVGFDDHGQIWLCNHLAKHWLAPADPAAEGHFATTLSRLSDDLLALVRPLVVEAMELQKPTEGMVNLASGRSLWIHCQVINLQPVNHMPGSRGILLCAEEPPRTVDIRGG